MSLRSAVENAAIAQAMANDGFRAALAQPNMAAALNSQAFIAAMQHSAFASALQSHADAVHADAPGSLASSTPGDPRRVAGRHCIRPGDLTDSISPVALISSARFPLRLRLVFVSCVVAFSLVAASPARAQLRVIETADVRLIYFDPAESFLVPHAVRTFLNSLAFQKRLFDFHPDGPITVLLADFSDAGNAGATVVPYNAVISQISPFSFAFETIAGNDRMNIIMNHELVHVATMDQAARPDRFFRRLFGGKVSPVHRAAGVDRCISS